MKSLKLLLLAGALFLGFNAVSAQTKIAHIDVTQLLSSMQETKQMQEEIKKIAQTYDTEYKAQMDAYQAKARKYEQEAPTQTDTENQKRGEELQKLQRTIQAYAQQAEQELAKKQQDLSKPIYEKVQKAIQDVAKEKSIQYVLDASAGRGIIVKDGEDLMAPVKAKLGVK